MIVATYKYDTVVLEISNSIMSRYLLQEGTSKQVAADLLGHADTAFLERTYCHPQNMAKREVANLMDDLLSPKNIYYQPYKFVRIGKKVG